MVRWLGFFPSSTFPQQLAHWQAGWLHARIQQTTRTNQRRPASHTTHSLTAAAERPRRSPPLAASTGSPMGERARCRSGRGCVALSLGTERLADSLRSGMCRSSRRLPLQPARPRPGNRSKARQAERSPCGGGGRCPPRPPSRSHPAASAGWLHEGPGQAPAQQPGPAQNGCAAAAQASRSCNAPSNPHRASRPATHAPLRSVSSNSLKA